MQKGVIFVMGLMLGVIIVLTVFVITNQRGHFVLAQTVDKTAPGDIIMGTGGTTVSGAGIFDMCWIVKKEKGKVMVKDAKGKESLKEIEMTKLAAYRLDLGLPGVEGSGAGGIRLVGIRNITFDLQYPQELRGGFTNDYKFADIFKSWLEWEKSKENK